MACSQSDGRAIRQRGGAFGWPDDARGGKRSIRLWVEERMWPTLSTQPPAKQPRQAAGYEAERAWRRCTRRQRRDGGVLEEPAKTRAEHLID